ncbi:MULTISPECIES: restriction endonuclease subunit S [Citrobacter]|uniref:restriction endonuclease subunit S n=1 Tax=Citrobacter TaxID=544 RepID=UPI001560F8B3|nr:MULTISPECIES: restriction endonuclease subunit S [Citrobacter]MBR7614988.1 restriction endonuclease subunit S [Citrobacter braakii]MDL4471859.1 restriction endonuclease subunit S [Citrobacter braakii]MDL4503588.1 restriction endonuclease subunit S [Citrobacter braakii]MDM3451986.1 restriction endonuclease subunit S [Citrobacter sp. Cb027]MEB8156943.1 restriction endonuclease subunit S [Citrobacter braakii]
MVPKGWNSWILSDICRKQISYGIVQTGDNLPNGIPCLRVVDLTRDVMRLEDMIRTPEETNKAYRKTILEKDEIVMALRGEIGLARIIDDNLVGANITRGLARISPETKVVLPEFLLWELRSPQFRADLIRRVGGSALQEISLTELRKVRTLLPPLLEQKKIAQILSTWDKAISVTEKLLTNSQQQKKALMQQLLTGKKRLLDENGVRFSTEWEFKKISEVATRVQRKNDAAEHPILTISSLSGFVRQDERYSRYMAGESVKNYILLKKGEFAYNKGNSKTYEFGCVFDLEAYEAGLVPHVYVCFRLKNGLSHRYFKYLFEADYLKPQLGALVNTGVRNNGLLNIKPTEFMQTKVPVPCFEEQESIADMLYNSSRTIRVLQDKLACLKDEKKALMQQLLTGKRRVKVEAEEAVSA